MLKIKRYKAVLVLLLVISLLTMYGALPKAKAASLTDAKDTISDSDLSAVATSTITFTTGLSLAVNQYIRVVFPVQFTGFNINNFTCPALTTASTTDQTIDCVVDPGETLNPGAYTVTIGSLINPNAAGPYEIALSTRDENDVVKESISVYVYIIDDVTMTADVESHLTFTIAGLDAGIDVNGVLTTATTTATTTPFGTLPTSASTTVGQLLTVATNADDGFTVTVQQTQELTSAAGSNINSFNNSLDDTGSTTPVDWAPPKGTLDNTYTYGHMGLTADDATLSWGGGDPFGAEKYAGLNSSDPLEIMYHTGPVSGAGEGEGIARVAYTAEISALQEGGDYSNTLTYICTPQY